MEERVQKLMAQANIGSRRACEALIEQGRVRVNGQVVSLGAKADPATDCIEVDGEALKLQTEEKIYIALNKPRNILSSNAPQRGDARRTVRDLIPLEGHLFTIGRLDAESDGLVVLTNDGDLAHRLTHPRFGHTKTYRAVVHGLPSLATLNQWQSGVELPEDGMTAPCVVRIAQGDKKLTTLTIIMTEGKKRQIRRVAAQLGHPIHQLTRTHIGKLGLGSLRPGDWRKLNAEDVRALSTPDINLPTPHRPRPTTNRNRFRPRTRTPFRGRGPKKK